MAQSNQPAERHEAEPAIPLGQRLFDRIFLLLIVSLLISGVLYNIWGLIETLGVPPLPMR